jgi:tetratricopeptide (TPR) repeat protein
MSIILAAALLVATGTGQDRNALRGLIRVPYVAERITLDLPAIRAERAAERLATLGPELTADRRNPRLLLRAALLLREMGDPATLDYARRAVESLLESKAAKPLGAEQSQQLVEAATLSSQFDLAEEGLVGVSDEHVRRTLEGELAIFRVWDAAGVALRAPSGDRLLALSVAALRRPEEAKAWSAGLEKASATLKRACQLAPKEPRAHRSLAISIVARAYVESALRWRHEQKTAVLMPPEGFAHFKEAANLAPDDVIAQWEAFEARVAMERGKGAENLPKDATKFVGVLKDRLRAVATSDVSDARRAREILAVVLVQTGQLAEGLKQLEQASGDPVNLRVGVMRARIHLGLGEAAEAATLARELYQREAIPEVALLAAAALEQAGQLSEADSLVTSALARDPGNPELRLARASFLLRDASGEGLSEARETLSALADLDDGDPLMAEAKFLRAVYFGLIGDLEAARLIVEQLPKGARVDRLRAALKGEGGWASSRTA